MENAAEALKMAAAIIIFIVALSCSFSLFGTAKQTADAIIGIRDRQAYLTAAELDNGILYTSSSAIQGDTGLTETQVENKLGVTTKGDRIVEVDDVIATIYRYSKEKYGVTIIKDEGEVLARFDSATESLMRSWDKYIKDSNGNLQPAVSEENKQIYINRLKGNLTNDYVTDIDLDLEKIYKSKTNGIYAPWGNDEEITRRINVDINGGTFKNGVNQEYEGKKLFSELSGRKIIEVTNEIDESKYVENSNLLQQYKAPTVEIIYIIR